jgi:hypothetical protein
MKFVLFDYYSDYDYGWDLDFVIGHFNKFNLIQGFFRSTEYLDWEPDISLTISFFNSSFFSFCVNVWIFNFSMSFLNYRNSISLAHTRGNYD